VNFDFSAPNLDREFPVRRNLVYFNHAAVAPLPRPVADAIEAHAENAKTRGAADWRRWYADVESAREKAAAFVGARREEISFVPSTSWGLNLVAQAVDWKPGDNVVGDDMEFPSNVYPWMLLEKRGVELRLARNRGGRVTAEDIAAKIDDRTRVVAVSWVAFHNGWVYPIEEIGGLCRSRGILFVVDAIQGLGALPLPLDVSRVAIEVLVADAHKWPYGSEGGAVFFVAERARESGAGPGLRLVESADRGRIPRVPGQALLEPALRARILPTANPMGPPRRSTRSCGHGLTHPRADSQSVEAFRLGLRPAGGASAPASRSPREFSRPGRPRATPAGGQRPSRRAASSSRRARASSVSPPTLATTSTKSLARSPKSTPWAAFRRTRGGLAALAHRRHRRGPRTHRPGRLGRRNGRGLEQLADSPQRRQHAGASQGGTIRSALALS
jgi:hypothetical protein